MLLISMPRAHAHTMDRWYGMNRRFAPFNRFPSIPLLLPCSLSLSHPFLHPLSSKVSPSLYSLPILTSRRRAPQRPLHRLHQRHRLRLVAGPAQLVPQGGGRRGRHMGPRPPRPPAPRLGTGNRHRRVGAAGTAGRQLAGSGRRRTAGPLQRRRGRWRGWRGPPQELGRGRPRDTGGPGRPGCMNKAVTMPLLRVYFKLQRI